MRQQVNLYQPIFRREERIFSAVAMLQLCALFAVGLLAIYGYGLWKGQGLNDEVERLERQRATSAQRLERLAEQYPARDADPALQARREALAEEKQRKQQALRVLRGGEVGNTRGFAEHFEGFARRRLNGLWLTHIDIYAGGSEMTLGGTALADQLVPRYLQLLSEEPVFQGTEFRRVQLQRDEDRRWEIDFTLRTRLPEEEGS